MLNITRKILALLTPRERWQVAGLLLAVIVMGLSQVASIGVILPFLNLLVNPEAASDSQWLLRLFEILGLESHQGALIGLGFVVLALLLLSNGFRIATIWAIHRFSWEKHHRLSVYLLEQYLAQPYVNFLIRNSADAGKNILTEVRQLTHGVLLPLLRLISSMTTALFMLGFLMWVNPIFSLLAAVVLGGTYGVIYLFVRRKLDRLGQARMRSNTQRFKAVNEAFGGIKDIKLMGTERSFVAQYTPPSRRLSRANSTREIIGAVPRHALEAVAFGGLLLVVLMLMATGGDVSNVIPMVGVFAFGAYRLLPALQEAFTDLSSLRFNQVVVDTIHQDMANIGSRKQPPVVPADAARQRLPFEQAIQLNGISFTYPNMDEPAIRDITITIPRNTSVALVGTTGAGKTTLVDVLLGLLTPQSGHLSVDETVVVASNLRSWQNLVGYVPQHIYLCDDTVARNIAFGVAAIGIDRAAVERAARIANVHEFIVKELPKGYDTVVGERGVRLSGGQRQRIGIARALYHDPEVLVLDEATNALDGITEEAVQEAIAQAAAAKTLVVIAHRLSTVRDCNMVYLLDHGSVVAQGTYQDLLDHSANFRAMAQVGA